MAGNENRVPAGWYPDNNMADTDRYWDGERWTEHVQPSTSAATAQQFSAPPGPQVGFEPQTRVHHQQPAQYNQAVPAPHPGGPAHHPEQRRGGGSRVVAIVVGLVIGLGLLFIIALAALVLVAGSSDEGPSTVEVEQGQVDGTATEAPTPAEDTSTVIGGDEPGELGTRENPLPFDVEDQLRFRTFGDADDSVWLTTILPPRDITAEVLAENQFNDPPPDGVLFVGFEATMTLSSANKEPLAPGFNFSWELLGGETAAVYDIGTIETESFGCGVVENGFDSFSEVFVGGTVSGTVCIPLPAEDLDHPDTQVAIHFIDDTRAVFGP